MRYGPLTQIVLTPRPLRIPPRPAWPAWVPAVVGGAVLLALAGVGARWW